jgi:hypothetical protein
VVKLFQEDLSMRIAIIKDTKCVNSAVFDDLETAEQFLEMGAFGEADEVAELPDGYAIGDTYESGEWSKKPEPPVADVPVDLGAAKSQAIERTKQWVEAELSKGMTYTDGKTYTVTLEKQNLLTSQLVMGSIVKENGVPDEQNFLSWNAKGEECTNWLFADLCALAYAVAQYVKPIVGKQQAAEIAISEAETSEEIDGIVKEFAV